MTYQNRKKRYEYYISRGDLDRANELKAKYPDVEAVAVKEEPKTKSKENK